MTSAIASSHRNIYWQSTEVRKESHALINGHKPIVIWLTGLSGAGKTSIASIIERKLYALGCHTCLLDGDNLRHGLNSDLGFSDSDRLENVRRIAEVSKLMVDAGLIVLVALISPFRTQRNMVRNLLEKNEFCEVFVDTPIHIAEERDSKGLYKKARRGVLRNFTGIDSPYEVPENPEIRIDTCKQNPEDAADLIVSYLRNLGILEV